MRTRFLPTDFTGVVGCGGPFVDLDFVAFPLPLLSHTDYPSVSGNLLRCFDDIPIFEAFGDVENLPIDNALCKFLFDVLPRFVDGDDLIDREEKSEVTPDEKKNGGTFTSLDRNELEFLSYEIPEMDASLPSLQETAGYSQINPLHLSFEIPDAECTLDALDSERLLHGYVDDAMISCNGGKLLFDFVLSEEFSKTENCEEIVKACTDPSKSISSDKADINCLRGNGHRERKNQDIRQKSNVEKASVFGESMSSDFHYLWDPCNYAKGRESITWGRSVDVKAVHELLMFNNDSDAAHTTDSPMPSDPTDIDSAASGAWVSRKSSRQMLDQITRRHSDIIKRSNISLTDHKDNIGKYLTKEAPQNSSKRPLQEKGFGGVALHSQGSPWTAEFFHIIRGQTRLYKQSASYDLSSPCFGSTKKSQRKSPSILDFHKQQGSTTKQKVTEQRRPKRRSSKSLHSSKNKKTSTSASGPSTWTPFDKRTSRKLSFSKNGCGGQTTLVWID